MNQVFKLSNNHDEWMQPEHLNDEEKTALIKIYNRLHNEFQYDPTVNHLEFIDACLLEGESEIEGNTISSGNQKLLLHITLCFETGEYVPRLFDVIGDKCRYIMLTTKELQVLLPSGIDMLHDCTKDERVLVWEKLNYISPNYPTGFFD